MYRKITIKTTEGKQGIVKYYPADGRILLEIEDLPLTIDDMKILYEMTVIVSKFMDRDDISELIVKEIMQ